MEQTIETNNDVVVSPTSSPSLGAKIMVMGGMMSVMAGTLTGAITYMNIGLNDNFYSVWLSSFLWSALIMAPMGFTAMTLLTKAAQRLLPYISENKRNLLIGLIMAVFMESMMALTTAANNIGFADRKLFLLEWWNGFLVALPVGLCLMMVVSTTIKPKVEKFLKS